MWVYTPEEIKSVYPDLSLEKIYSTITYYLHNQKEVDAYLIQFIKKKTTDSSPPHPLSLSPPTISVAYIYKFGIRRLQVWKETHYQKCLQNPSTQREKMKKIKEQYLENLRR
jgi:hypothetical protein